MNNDFANRLKKVRKDQGYTQQQLAQITDIPLENIRRWEQSKKNELPNSLYLLTLAEALDVTAEFLLKGMNNMNIYTSAIKAELIQIRKFEHLQKIRNMHLNSTILSHLELSDDLVTDIKDAWMSNKLFERYCTRNYVREVIWRYCQNRGHFRKLFGLKDGTLSINV